MDYLLHRKPLFHELQTDGKVPQEILEKLIVVPADLQRAGLGLSEQDEKRLVVEVQFVIHCAASISFFEHVHTLLDQNYEVRVPRNARHEPLPPPGWSEVVCVRS